MVPSQLRPLLEWNPLTPLMRLYRAVILGTEPGGLAGAAYAAAVAAGLLVLGSYAFARCRPFFADHL
jgi:ABC-type polysaccharide/polyol phosphate export permease